MKYEEYTYKLELLLKMIRSHHSATPAELAKHLHVSERTVRRMINQLRKGENILYSRRSRSYVIV